MLLEIHADALGLASAPIGERRGPGHLVRSLVCLAGLTLAAGSAVPQPLSADASRSPELQPCRSAQAVHDVRCPNYTGFKTSVGEPADAGKPFIGKMAASKLAEVGNSASGLSPNHGEPTLKPGSTLQRGEASWYGPGFQGRLTANGERFNMNELTAAHRTLPFGTRLLVENPRTGKQVVVRINDRGPFVGGRIIDLSKAAAGVLGMVGRGRDAVVVREVQVLGRPDIVASADAFVASGLDQGGAR